MKIYATFGYCDFVIPLGYKGEVIKRYFADYASLAGDLTVEIANGTVRPHSTGAEDWTVRLFDTGLNTATGGRMRRVREQLDSTFMMTFGDGVSDVDINDLIRFHKSHGKLATLTAVRPPGSAMSSSTATRSTSSPRSPRPGKAGSTAASSSSSPASSTTSSATTCTSRRSRSSAWPRRDS
jgi:glucose-1-phosphate cytidylyltransferase